MKFKNKWGSRDINLEYVMNFTIVSDPFIKRTHTLVLTMDNGTQDSIIFFSLMELEQCMNELIPALKLISQYKTVHGGVPAIDSAKRKQLTARTAHG